MNVCAKFLCAPLCIKKALGIFRELVKTRTRTTTVAFWDPPPGPKIFTNADLISIILLILQSASVLSHYFLHVGLVHLIDQCSDTVG